MPSPTPQQQAIIDAILDGTKGNIAAVARAGTGKTSVYVMASEFVDPSLKVIACAFNASIAKTMAEKLPAHWISKTTHSLAYSGVRQRFNRKLEVKSGKCRDIIKSIDHSDEFPDIMRAVGIAKAWGIVPKGALADPRTMHPDTPETYQELFRKYSLDTGDHPDPIGLVRQVLLTSIQQAWRGIIDFDDMLYLAYIYKAPLEQGDLILIDEAQDIAPIQRGLLHQMMHSKSRLIAIGDDRQAIYGFRGADRQSLPKIIEEFNCEVLPLTISFRCAQTVIEAAQDIVKDIEPWPANPQGEVRDESEPKLNEIPRGSAILCRNNAPLVKVCLMMIKQGIGATILGRDIAVGLQQLIDRQKARELGELSQKLWQDVDHRKRLLEDRGKAQQAALLEDKAECIEALIGFQGRDGSIRGVKDQLFSMFSDKSGVITLSTIHKAKGLEWQTVYFLDIDLIPSKYAKGQEEMEQEMNLQYVGITRAMHTLIFISSEDIK